MRSKHVSQAKVTTANKVAVGLLFVVLAAELFVILCAAWSFETAVEKANGGVFHFKKEVYEP